MSSNGNEILDADSIANIANELLAKIGYTHHTVKEMGKKGRVWKMWAEADKIELTLDEKGKMLGYVLYKK